MKIGFTGTQEGMAPEQLDKLHDLLAHVFTAAVSEFHHGDCIGADAEAHEIALSLGYDIVIHPPTNENKRAFCDTYKKIYEPKPYLDRNHNIVDSCDVLIVAPKTNIEELQNQGHGLHIGMQSNFIRLF